MKSQDNYPNSEEKTNSEKLPEGTFYGGLGIRFRNYNFCAYPGPEAAENGKEHLPLHFHIKSPDAAEYKVDCKTFKDRRGRAMPKDLRKFLRNNRLKIRARTLDLFLTGSWN